MLKSRALILSGSNGEDESWAPCWCQQADRQTDHTQCHNLFLVIHLFYCPLLINSPRPFSSSVLFGYLPLPLLTLLLCLSFFLSLAALFLLYSLPPTHHQRAHIHPTLPHLTLINGDSQRWQHHYSCAAATPPRTEKNERKREDEGQDRRKIGSDGGGVEAAVGDGSTPQADGLHLQGAWCCEKVEHLLILQRPGTLVVYTNQTRSKVTFNQSFIV